MTNLNTFNAARNPRIRTLSMYFFKGYIDQMFWYIHVHLHGNRHMNIDDGLSFISISITCIFSKHQCGIYSTNNRLAYGLPFCKFLFYVRLVLRPLDR